MDQDIDFSQHAKDMLIERNILEDWVLRTIHSFDNKQIGADNNMHYSREIKEMGNRVLHVVVNPHVQPNRVVTVFFDRRLRRKK